ncbi:hypothetical protein LCGC14_2889400 [marine sediment metagenome]|uniref:Uncharacterized protein n=1 Tax=marine sediment metagenome TaxID=412755 RepID=A0A0F8XY14_9ZZZZ
MITVISPAKRLDWTVPRGPVTLPAFQDEANILAGHARQLSLGDLKGLMGLSDDLARLNRDRFREMAAASTELNSRPAALAFAGDTYKGLDAASLTPEAWAWADDHLRILSGLYGLLRPRDAIQPYRLEMGSRLKTRRGSNLYQFWGDRIACALNELSEAGQSRWLVNCASQEYFGAVDPKALKLPVVTPVFMEDKDGTPRVVSFFAKQARGAMARHICTHGLTDPEALRSFDLDGYRHQPELSTAERPVFVRPYRTAASKAA